MEASIEILPSGHGGLVEELVVVGDAHEVPFSEGRLWEPFFELEPGCRQTLDRAWFCGAAARVLAPWYRRDERIEGAPAADDL